MRSSLEFQGFLSLLGAALIFSAVGCFKDPASPNHDPAALRLSDSSLVFSALDTSALVVAEIFDQHENAVLDTQVTWMSLDTAIARVDALGKITAVANGETQVLARFGSLSASVHVRISQIPAYMLRLSDSLVGGEVAKALGQPVTVVIQDAKGIPIPGNHLADSVQFEADASGRVEPGKVRPDPNGRASVVWILGPKSGSQHLQASLSVKNLKVDFIAEAHAGQPAKLVEVLADSLSVERDWVGQVGKPLSQAIEVELRDEQDNPIPGVGPHRILVFSPSSNGQAMPASVVIDSNGRARCIWTLGTKVGLYQMQVKVDGTDLGMEFSARALPGPPAQLVRISGETQVGVARKNLPAPLRAKVLDAFSNPVPEVLVKMATDTDQGMGSPDTVTSDSLGEVVTDWTLGPGAGTQVLSMAVHDSLSLDFHAISQIGTVAALSDTQQVSLSGRGVNVPPAIRFTDFEGKPVPGVGVTFEVSSGGGAVTDNKTRTDSLGIARVGKWVLGQSLGLNQMIARIDTPNVPGNPVRFSSTSKARAFAIALRYLGNEMPSERHQAAFEAAKARWESLIFGDLPDVKVNVAQGEACQDSTFPAIDEIIDDIVIYIKIRPIDGEYGTLGKAGPCMIRRENGLPIFGSIQFDSDDLNRLETNGQLQAVALHEMGHVLGFGSLWKKVDPLPGFLENPCAVLAGCATNPQFTGSRALSAYREIFPHIPMATRGVPVENCDSTPECNSGTINAHWRESHFDDELMTGYLNPGMANPLSSMTLASLWDLGYSVDYSGADEYPLAGKPLGFAGLETPQRPIEMFQDMLSIPITIVDAQGRKVGVLKP